jgi:catechol 2,3-dioxygenase-like lactoylglutathione lyase family enzyme
MAKIVDLHHASFTVADMQRSLRFYRDLLGMEVMFERDVDGGYIADIVAYQNLKMKAVLLMGGGEKLELIQYISPRGTAVDPDSKNPGTAHLAFVVDDAFEWHKTLTDAGVKIRSPRPVLITSGAHKDWHAFYLYDPDGISLEFMQPPKQG